MGPLHDLVLLHARDRHVKSSRRWPQVDGSAGQLHLPPGRTVGGGLGCTRCASAGGSTCRIAGRPGASDATRA
eukprot:15457684-Alexandrium_andersonii.AAC.1